jgi:H+-transporting ATPase
MLTYTLNKLVKTIHVSVFLTAGFLWLGDFILQPRHVLLLLLANDLVTMSIATDRVRPSPHPDRWDVAALLRSSVPIAGLWTLFSLAVLLFAHKGLHLRLPQVQTLVFLVLVATAQANVYLVRTRASGGGEDGWPSLVMLGGSALALLSMGILAASGLMTARLPVRYVVAVYGTTALLSAAAFLLKGRR